MADKTTKIIIGAEVSQAEAALKKLNGTLGQMEQAATRLKNPFQALGPHLLSPVAAATAGFAALGAAIKKTADAGEEMGKFAQQAGVSVEWISGMKYAAEQSETSVESLVTGLGLLSKGMAEGGEEGNKVSDALKALGINAKNADGTLRPTEALFAQIAEKFSGMEDGAGKTALSMQLFGRSGKELIPLLNEGASGIEAMRKEAERLGIVMSTDAAKAADSFNDNLSRLGKHFDGMVHTIGNSLIPALNRLFELFEGKGPSESTRLTAVKDELRQIEEYMQRIAAGGRASSPGEIAAMGQRYRALLGEETKIQGGMAAAKKTPAPSTGSAGSTKKPDIFGPANEQGVWQAMKEQWKEAEEAEKALAKLSDDRAKANLEEAESYWKVIDSIARKTEQIEFETSLIGKHAFEVEKLQALRELEISGLGRETEEYKALADAMDKALDKKQYEQALDDAIKNTEKRKPLEEPVDDFWKEMNRATANWGKDLTLALDDALMGGKGSFDKLLDSFADSFRRIVIDELISKQLEKALQGAMDSMLGGSDIKGAGGFGGLSGLSGLLDIFRGGGSAMLGSASLAGTTQTMGFINAGFMHDGGYVVPRFHSGIDLRRDEVPAILQTGEGVLSRRGMSALDMLNSGRTPSTGSGSGATIINHYTIQAWDGTDVERVLRKHKHVVTGLVGQDIERNGGLRGIVAGA